MLVSVVICTYNRVEYLKRCIESLKRQTYLDFEIIVVNGPSTDETNQILEKYPEIQVLKQQTLSGLSYARNMGIKASNGEIIAFIDDDAVADKNWINFLIDGYTDESVGGAGGPVFDITGKWHQFKNGYISKAGIPSFIQDNDLNYNDPKGAFLNNLMGTNSSFKRDILLKIGLFDDNIKYFFDETDVCVRIIMHGYKIKHLDNAIVFHEMTEGHNRKSPYDLNWSEIMKNSIYFIVKNFKLDFASYTVRPCRSLIWRMRTFISPYINNEISLIQLFKIYLALFEGAIKGYICGIITNINNLYMKRGVADLCVLNDASSGELKRHDDSNKKYIPNCPPTHVEQEIIANDKLKIALLSQEFSKNCNGGVCRYTYDLAHALAEFGNEVHVVTKSGINRECSYKDGDVFIHEIVPEQIDFLDLPANMNTSIKNLTYSYSACLKLLDLIDKHGIQVVEAPLWDAEGFVFSLIKPVPLITRLETPLFKVAEIQKWKITKDLKFANWMEGETIRRADKAIAISKDIGKLISAHHRIPEQQIDLCPLGIEIPDENLLRSDESENGLDVLFVGRLEKRKGIETLFKAIPLVLEKVPDAKFYFVGKDTNLAPNGMPYEKYLLNNLDKQYHRNINFVGYVNNDELKNYYRNCDLFVAPSLYESFGLIYLEAMAWGKPVIGCNVGGIPDIVSDGKDGILVQSNDEKALANAIIDLLLDCDRRIVMGKDGRKKVIKYLNIKRMGELTKSIYDHVLSHGKCKPSNDILSFRDKLTPEIYDKLLEKQTQISIHEAFERYNGAHELFNYIENYVTFGGKNILDIGCGIGNGALALMKKGASTVVGIDINFEDFGYNYFNEIAELLDVDTKDITFTEGDICNNQIFEPESFDIIVAVDSFEHIVNPEKAFQNCNYFLKPGGYIVIDVGPLYYSPIGHHVWSYFPKDTDPWIHLRCDDISKVKEIDKWSLDHFHDLNKVTVGDMRKYISSMNMEIICEVLTKCGEDLYEKYAPDIKFNMIPHKDDLFIENVTYIIKKY